MARTSMNILVMMIALQAAFLAFVAIWVTKVEEYTEEQANQVDTHVQGDHDG